MKNRLISIFTIFAVFAGIFSAYPTITAEENPEEPPAQTIPGSETDTGGELDTRIWCHPIGDEECTFRRVLGDVVADGVININDVWDILRYLSGEEDPENRYSSNGSGSCAWNAALITGSEEPTFADAYEILLETSGYPSMLSGTPAKTPSSPTGLFRAEIDHLSKTVNFYNAMEIKADDRYLFEFSTQQYLSFSFFRPGDIIIEDDSAEGKIVCLTQNSKISDGYICRGLITSNDNIPENTLIMKQSLDFIPLFPVTDIIGDSIAETVVLPCMGDVNSDYQINIFDALEILKHLVGMNSSIELTDTALITENARNTGEPTIFDALEILKYLVGTFGEIEINAILNPYKSEEFVDLRRTSIRGILRWNGITDSHLAAIIANEKFPKNVKRLYLDNNQITDLSPLSALTSLERLDLSFNNISDISPLRNLTNLTNLNLWGYDHNITDISPLSNLTNLTKLNLSHSKTTDISPLSNLTNLEWLSVSVNRVLSDISPLSGLTKLRHLELYGNDFSDLSPLSNLIDLEYLVLSYNSTISDISPLSNLTKLKLLGLDDNGITDLSPLSELLNLTELWLSNNNITDLSPLRNLTKLECLSLTNNNINDLSVFYEIQDGNLTSPFTNLRFLYFDGDPLISIAQIEELFEAMPWLWDAEAYRHYQRYS